MKKVVVIGGGIGGLASAALLAKDGYEVTVIEKNKQLGGRARYLKVKNFYFDMGPSWYMMPEVFDNYFKLFNKKTSNFYNLIKLKSKYKIFFSDGSNVLITKNLNDNIKTLESLEKNSGNKFKKLLEKSKIIYHTSLKDLVFLSYKDIFWFLKPNIIKAILKINKHLFLSTHNNIKKYFKNQKIQQLLEYTTVFLGGSPFNTPSFYQLLVTHTDYNQGIYYPENGIYDIVKALIKLNNQYNVKIKTNEPVIKIKIINNQVVQVMTKKNKYQADYIVVNADYQWFETNILPKKYQTYDQKYWNKKTMSPSAFLIYLGIKDHLPKSDHHNLYFAKNWEKHFNSIYGNTQIPEDLSFYYHIPSKTNKKLAPKNHHSVMILVPIPANKFFEKKEEELIYKKIINKFAEINQVKEINKKIIFKKIFQAKDFHEDYNAYKGAAFGLAHTLFQTAVFRPKNFSQKLKNLFYVGQYTNPGVGVPPALISAQIVYNLIKENDR